MLHTQTSLQAQASEFLDPNKWSSDGTVALCDYAFSKDGSLMAYSTGRWGKHSAALLSTAAFQPCNGCS